MADWRQYLDSAATDGGVHPSWFERGSPISGDSGRGDPQLERDQHYTDEYADGAPLTASFDALPKIGTRQNELENIAARTSGHGETNRRHREQGHQGKEGDRIECYSDQDEPVSDNVAQDTG